MRSRKIWLGFFLTLVRAVATAALFATAQSTPAKAQSEDVHYITQIRFTAAEFCPEGYLPTDGRMLRLPQNTWLFSLIGTRYGGNVGIMTFGLPKIEKTPINTAGAQLLACIAIDGSSPAAQYAGEVAFLATDHCPEGWLPADGREVPIEQYEELFNLIGNRFGGNTQTTLALPKVEKLNGGGGELIACVAGYGRRYPVPAHDWKAHAESYMGTLLFLPTDFCPEGWLPADGRALPINQYQALFNLLGTRYGGNGMMTFGLPKLEMPTETPGAPLMVCLAVTGPYPSRR
jgi:microcystin-dependent protein